MRPPITAGPNGRAGRTARPDEEARREDGELMAAFLRQDTDGARSLYDRFASRIYGLGIVLLRDATDAEDLVQDTFLKIWRSGSAFDPRRGSLDAWVLLNARSLAIDLLRRRSLEERKIEELPKATEASDEPSPESVAETRILFDRANEAMAQLPPRQRAALELTYLGQRSTREAAEIQGVPRGTVKSRVHAGLASLQKTFGGMTMPPEHMLGPVRPPATLGRTSIEHVEIEGEK